MIVKNPPTHYIVQTAAARMPANCKGRYGKVAVLEVDLLLQRVSMISERARGCHRIVAVWDKQHIGKTDASAFYRCLDEAVKLAAELNWSPCSDDEGAAVEWDEWLEDGGTCPVIAAGVSLRMRGKVACECPDDCPRKSSSTEDA